ncbi:MAG: DUF4139 domain-containing protein [Crocinitomicaceae bacterium]|nr:DUF4139 domain-containing protein [Crocinitomicaceae bacterium]
MKKSILLLTIFFTSISVNAIEENIVKSKVTEVTVYAKGVQLFQKANYTIKSGSSEIIIEGISPFIDPNSIQVRATGDVIILDSKHTIFYPKPEPVTKEGMPLKIKRDIQLLQDSLRMIGYDIQEIQDEINVFTATRNILSANGAVKGQGKVNDSIELLQNTLDYYAKKMLQLNKKLLLLKKKKAVQVDIKSKMNKRLRELKNYQKNSGLLPKKKKPIHRIVVTLMANKSVNGKVFVNYLSSNAGWIPHYDFRTKKDAGKVNLNYKAKVYQNTGLDWKKVKVNISTNNPYQNKTKPTLHPWYLDYAYAYKKDKYNSRSNLATPSRMKKEMAVMGYVNSNANGAQFKEDAKKLFEDNEAKRSDEFVSVVRQLVSAEFKIDLPYSIKSNNDHHIVLIKNIDLEAKFKHFAVPKLDQSVYLVAQISKFDELGLVPAKANIFFDGSYMGETYVDPTSMDDTLSLSLGKDPNVQIKRKLLKKNCKEKVIGDKVERNFAYSIEVKNLKSTPINLTLLDQIPITQNGDISIEAKNISNAKKEDRTGILEWRINLKPKDKKVIDFKFKIKHDKNKRVII